MRTLSAGNPLSSGFSHATTPRSMSTPESASSVETRSAPAGVTCCQRMSPFSLSVHAAVAPAGAGARGGYSGLSVGRRVERDDQRERQKCATSGHGDHDVPPVGPYIPPARAGAQERGGFNRRKRAGPLSEC